MDREEFCDALYTYENDASRSPERNFLEAEVVFGPGATIEMTDDGRTDDLDADFLAFLDELRIMAQVGLEHADDPYDEERYERMLELVGKWYGRAVDLPPEEVRSRFAAEVGHVTPKVGGNAAVFDGEGRILLQRRADDGTWNLPGGFTDANESPRETAVRETREETELVVEPVDLVDAYTRRPGEHGPHGMVVHVYLCERERGTLRTSHEGTDVGYRSIDDVPAGHKNHERMARAARDHWRDAR